jgi:hypothetical protein
VPAGPVPGDSPAVRSGDSGAEPPSVTRRQVRRLVLAIGVLGILHLALCIPLALAAWIAVAAPVLRTRQSGTDDRRLVQANQGSA